MERLSHVARHVLAPPRGRGAGPSPAAVSAEAPHVRVTPPGKKHFATNPWERLARWEGDGGPTKAETIPARFARRAASHGHRYVMAQKRGARDGPWTRWTWADYSREVREVAKGFIALGCQRYQAVNVLASNSPEWYETAMGGIMAGLTPAGIYITNNPDGVKYILNHSKAPVILVDCDDQLQKVLAVRSECPHLKAIVHWGADCPKGSEGIISWKEFVGLSAKVADAELDARIAEQQPDNACYLSYTSGTTGNPKAVMFSHDNILWGFTKLLGYMALSAGGYTLEEREVSYMPLSHVAGNVQLLGAVCLPEDASSEVYFAFPDAMQGSLPDTLKEVRPTIFFGVPRVWEKFHPGLLQLLKARPELKSNPTAVKAFLGLDQVKFAGTGAAPIHSDVMEFYDSIELPLFEVYGMTENVAYSHINYLGKRRIGSVGPELRDEGAGAKFAKGTNEICCWSRAMMMGYMYMPEKTAETFDDEGFLHTGDVGEEVDGFTFITGRIKEMIITAGGENMAPVLLEAEIKKQLPALSNVVMIGDYQKYLIALFTLKLMPDGLGGFTDQLDPIAQAVDPACRTVGDVQKSKAWEEYLAKGVELANASATSRAQHTRKYCILPRDFVAVGEACELTPTMKLKRDVVQKKYLVQIRATYGEDFRPFPK